MKKTRNRIQKEYEFNALGFPITLVNVPMVQLRGDFVPDIDYNQLEDRVFEALASKPTRLTGNEVRFIRFHANMTLKAFGQRFGRSHAAVKKWEGFADNPTNMDWTTEKDIRLFVQCKASRKASEFQALYQRLVEVARPAGGHLVFDVSKGQVATA